MSATPEDEDAPRRVQPTDWQRVPMPPGWLTFPCDQAYTFEQFETLKMGIYPREMEEKWFICWEQPWLRMYRSWTGYEVYALEFEVGFEGARAVELRVNGDRDVFTPPPEADHLADALSLLAVLFGGADVEADSPEQALKAWAQLGSAAVGSRPEVGVRPSEVSGLREREAGPGP